MRSFVIVKAPKNAPAAMKYILFVIILCLPLLLSSQTIDSLSLSHEIDSLVQVSRTLSDKRNLVEALKVIEDAKSKAEVWFGKISAIYATCIHTQSRIYILMGKYAYAEPLGIEAKEIRAHLFGTENLDYAASLHNLGVLYYYKGDYSKSEELHLEAKKIRANVLSTEHQDYAMSLYNLALVYLAKGDYAHAELMFLDVKRIDEKTIGHDNSDYASLLNAYAYLNQLKGDYLNAELMFLESKEIRAKTLGKVHPLYSASLNNLAGLYLAKGDYSKAELLYLEAIDIFVKTVGKENAGYGSAMNNLGVLYDHEGDYGKAEPFLLEAKEVRAKVLGKEHLDYAGSLNGLAALYQNQGAYAKAEPFYLESKEIRAKVLGKEHPDYAATLTNLAILYKEMKEFTKAESLFLEAKEIRDKSLGKLHPDYLNSIHNIALFYQETNRIPEASTMFLEMNDLAIHLIRTSATYSSESQMLAYLFKFTTHFDEFQSFALDHPNPNLSRTCYDNALILNGYLLENTIRLSSAVENLDSLTRETFVRWQGCRRRLANEYAKPIAKRQYIEETEDEAENYEKILTRNLPAFDEARNAPHCQEVRNHLRDGEAAVEFIHFHYYNPDITDSIMYAALILLPNDSIPHFVPLFEEKQLLALIQKSVLSEELIIKDIYVNRPELSQLFWKPLEPLLHDIKTIYYTPSGLLHKINPAALLDETGNSISRAHQWVRMGSSRELLSDHLASSSFAFEKSQQILPGTNSATIYGGITYEMDSLAFIRANSLEIQNNTLTAKLQDGNFHNIIEEQNSGSRGSEDFAWPQLPQSGVEADKVATLLKNAGFYTELNKDFYASEENFKKIGMNGSSPRILHIATHGFVLPDSTKNIQKTKTVRESSYKATDDPLLHCGLILAGGNFYWKKKRPLSNHEDGVLVGYEVCNQNLRNTELAVLSACQTGLGDVIGSEGVYGLQRAFRIAGVKFLIVSLWHIPDEKTMELMQLFYQNWIDKKESLRDAFSKAQHTMQEKEGNPYLWAGFVLVE
ncbi:MAG: CHAT domain-containing protein [Saprospiraceae bacterium]|uniref:CHAT domain-containing protein n=1 Tax=Candidatus Opimibacter skivensis TaxID=2982028 RepID=A0A9D7XSD4_9BACT|nr:CHAT domain-containing protein [Candidatus Opimibacter skivensis]